MLLKTIRSSSDPKELMIIKEKAKQEDGRFMGQVSLFFFEKKVQNESFISELYNAQILTIGPELVFAKVYDHIGYKKVNNDLFLHLVTEVSLRLFFNCLYQI